MITEVKSSKTIKELIYATENLAYYFGLTPDEFWDGEYRQISKYIQINMIKMVEDYKRNINLNDATTDKMIRADSLSNKRPKVISLRKTFKGLFKEEEPKQQSIEEQVAILRSMKK